MKRLLALTIIIISFSSNWALTPVSSDITFDVFYANLSPYGEWIEIERGMIVWHPTAVSGDWQPYSNGRWTYTEHGWYWDSYEHFGWATAHYGRWFFDDYYGWLWFPDYEWGPSWVEWRYGDNHIGWAPLPPYARYSREHGINFSISWNSGYNYWRFVNYTHFCNNNIAKYYYPKKVYHHIWNKTKYRNNYKHRNGRIYNAGIDRNVIERRGHTRIKNTAIQRSNSIAPSKQRNSKSVVSYRPTSSKGNRIDKSKIIRGKHKSSINKERATVNGRHIDDKSTNKKKTISITHNRHENRTKETSQREFTDTYHSSNRSINKTKPPLVQTNRKNNSNGNVVPKVKNEHHPKKETSRKSSKSSNDSKRKVKRRNR